MGIVLLFALLLILGVVLYFVGENKYCDFVAFCGVIGSVFSALALVISLVILIDQKNDFKVFKTEYESTKAMIESYQGFDYGNAIPLTEKMLEINEKIARNKVKHDTFWFGWYYDESIGNLEPLAFKQIFPEIYE